MKLYDYPGAPNPRRVTIFIREKGIDIETEVCDMSKGEHKTPEFLRKNPSGKIPVLELDDGRCIPESVAICRYLEAIHPEPNLFGRDAFELAHIDASNRMIEFELWSPIGTSWINGPIVAKMGRFKPIAEAKAASDKATHRFYQRLDSELAGRDFIAGDRFTVADISALTAIDFAASMVDLKPDEDLTHLWDWHARVSARPSIAA